MHRYVVNTVVVWLLILGRYWCLYVALFGSRLSYGMRIKHTPMYFKGLF